MSVTDPRLTDEAARLAALRGYQVLDTPREPAFDRLTNLIQTVLHVPICAVSLVDKDRQWFKSCVGLTDRQTSRDVSFCSYAIQERGPMMVPDAMLDERFAQNPLVLGAPFIRSYLGIPLCTPEGYNVGSLCVMDVVPRTYAEDKVEVLKSFASLVVNELELRRIAVTDHLTGVLTRRGFIHEVEKAFSVSPQTVPGPNLIVLDVDYFKLVNDTYGHLAGDRVLCSVAKLLTAHMRHGDSLGRLGGEEFGILLIRTSVEEALETAERLRTQLASSQIENDPPLRVTASFGIAALRPDIVSVEGWVAAADEALYRAKKAGRNRSCTSGGVAAVA